jgi:uncharacterized SAM-binding protein YcdF (DUF218 family)
VKANRLKRCITAVNDSPIACAASSHHTHGAACCGGRKVFAVKSLVGEFLHPLNAWVAMSLVGIAICVWKPKSLGGTLVMLAGTIGLLIASCPVTGRLLLRPLENMAGTGPNLQEAALQRIRYVVVLGNIAEGVNLWTQLPGSTLVVSSGSYSWAMVEQARVLGVPDSAMIIENEARDTQEQAVRLKPILKSEPFILSTWALHMPRTLLIFEKQGLHPVPAPSDFLARSQLSPDWFWPSASGMDLTRHALHEFVGTLWVLAQSSRGRR